MKPEKNQNTNRDVELPRSEAAGDESKEGRERSFSRRALLQWSLPAAAMAFGVLSPSKAAAYGDHGDSYHLDGGDPYGDNYYSDHSDYGDTPHGDNPPQPDPSYLVNIPHGDSYSDGHGDSPYGDHTDTYIDHDDQSYIDHDDQSFPHADNAHVDYGDHGDYTDTPHGDHSDYTDTPHEDRFVCWPEHSDHWDEEYHP